MPIEALQKLRAQHPGAYDDLSDQALAQQVLKKYPGYKDLLGDVARGPADAAPQWVKPPPATGDERFGGQLDVPESVGQAHIRDRPNFKPAMPPIQGPTKSAPPPRGFGRRVLDTAKRFPGLGSVIQEVEDIATGQGANMRPTVDPVDVAVAAVTGGAGLVPKVASGVADVAGQVIAEKTDALPTWARMPAAMGGAVLAGKATQKALGPRAVAPPTTAVLPPSAPPLPGPPRALGPGTPPPPMKALPPAGGTSPTSYGTTRTFEAGPMSSGTITTRPQQATGVKPGTTLPLEAPGPGGAAIMQPESIGRAAPPFGEGGRSGGQYSAVAKDLREKLELGVRELAEPPAETGRFGPRLSPPPNVAGQREPVTGQVLPPGRTPAATPDPSVPKPSPLSPPALEAAPPGWWGHRMGQAREIGLSFSPDQYKPLRESSEPAARTFGGFLFREDANFHATLVKERARLRDEIAIPLKRGGHTPEELTELLDNIVDPARLTQVATTQPMLMRAYQAGRAMLDDYAGRLGIDPGKRIRDYYPHMWEREQLRDALQAWLPELQASGQTDMVKAVVGRISSLDNRYISSFSQLPQEIRNAFLLRRQGAEGYTKNAIDALNQYVGAMAKKVHGDKILDQWNVLSPKIQDGALVRHAGKMVERFTGRGIRDTTSEAIDRMARNLEYADKLWLNPRWGFLVNLPGGQMMNVAKLGPDYVAGVRLAMTPEGREFYTRSGHSALSFLSDVAKHPKAETVQDVLTLGAGRLEYANRIVAYTGQIAKDLRKQGLSFEQIREALRTGQVPDRILYRADDAVRQTQGTFGLANPEFFERPGIKAFTQFGAIPAKMLQTYLGWWKHAPLKAAALTALMESYEEGLRSQGINIGGAFGVGIDLPEAVEGAVSGDNQKLLAAFIKPWQEHRQGILAPGISGPFASRVADVGKFLGTTSFAVLGKPGAVEKLPEQGLKVIPGGTLVQRSLRVAQPFQHGPGGVDALHEAVQRGLLNSDYAEGDVREYALKLAKNGQQEEAKSILALYSRRHGAPVRIDSRVWQESLQTGKAMDRERAAAKKARPPGAPPENLPPRVQRALQ